MARITQMGSKNDFHEVPYGTKNDKLGGYKCDLFFCLYKKHTLTTPILLPYFDFIGLCDTLLLQRRYFSNAWTSDRYELTET